MNVLERVWELLTRVPEQPQYLEKVDYYVNEWSINMLYKFIISMTRFFQRVMLVTPTEYMRSSEFWQIYNKVIYLSISLLAIFLSMLALMKLFGKSVNIEETGKKLLLFPFIIVLAPYFLFRVIEIFNRISLLIINTEGMIPPKRAEAFIVLGILVFMGIYLFLLFKLILFYAERVIWIILFAVLIPLVFSLWIIPKYENIVNEWCNKIIGLLLVQVIHSLVLLILGTLIIGLSNSNAGLTIVYQVGGLLVMNKADKEISRLLQNSDYVVADKSYKDIKAGAKKVTSGVKKAVTAGRRLFGWF
ncbi:MAG: hypothetical protein ACOC2W_03315 [bacterium]